MNAKQQTIKLFSYLQLGIVLLFILIVIFGIIRITELGKILENITDRTIPEITQASTLINQVQNLATLTTILSISETSPAHQLSQQKIQSSIDKINIELRNRSTDSQLLTTQFATITLEINELNQLVQQRIEGQQSFLKAKRTLNDRVLGDIKELRTSGNNNELEDHLLNMFLLAFRIEQQNRLHEIRQIEISLASIVSVIRNDFANEIENGVVDINGLENLLLGSNGLINQKIKSLRTIGRTRGRGNFVRNLIGDIASNLQYQNFITNRESIGKAKEVSALATEYSKLTIIAAIVSILLTLGLIYFLHKRIVSRLISLSLQVQQASKDKSALVSIKGNDEISVLADTFSTYLNKVKEQENALLDVTLTDPLTGIPNRRAYEQKLTDTLDLAARNKWCVTVLLIDVDFFKLYNDHYGHTQGDECLSLIANNLCNHMSRKSDFCARFGGEEFVCILPNTDLEGAKQIAEMLRAEIEALQLPHADSSISDVVTISLGAASLMQHNKTEFIKDKLVLEADKALYKAKAEGRNCCRYYCD
jgi:diguanylate cyclase (GGDEF)-like protein